MNKFLFLLCAVLVAGSLSAQKVLEGTITYSYTLAGPDGADLGSQAQMMQGMMPERMTVTYGKEGVITRMEGGMLGGMMGNIVVNAADRKVYVLQDRDKVAYVMEQNELEATSEESPIKEMVDLDETENILGYDCRKYRLVVAQGANEVEQTVWVTDQIVLPSYDMPGLERFNSVLAGGELPGFPLQTLISLPGMNMGMLMTATGLSFEPVDAGEFALPDGYTTKDFSELSQQFGGN